jgi:hypothetical protein
MSLLGLTAQKFATKKAAKEVVKALNALGLDNLRLLVDANASITDLYLKGLSDRGKANFKQNLNILFRMGITPQMLWEEMSRQIPELVLILKDKETYIRTEIAKLDAFLKS